MLPVVASSSTAGNSAPNAAVSENCDSTVYSTLRSIFPDVESPYLRKICPPESNDSNTKSSVICHLVDHLLQEGGNHLKEPVVLTLDQQYENLTGIFPNADPTFLRNFLEENFDKPDVVEEFIQQKLETHDYPSKKECLAKIKITEQIKEYTTDFNVEKFLKMFPDPVKHFEDEKRICTYDPIAIEFLKSHYNKNKIRTIDYLYWRNKFNLSLTAKSLTSILPDMVTKRKTAEMQTENIPLLQEIAFVKHKERIVSYLNSMKVEKEKLFKELQEKKLLLTCQCCFNDECLPNECVKCSNNHIFCNNCLIKGTEVALGKGDPNIKCFIDCENEFSLATLQKVLAPTTFSALLKQRQAAEVTAAEIEGLVSCPFCYFASIPPPDDKVFKCLNPECMKESCRQCKELNHIPLRCDEVVKTDKARLLLEEKMTEALLRTCYKCNCKFFKEEGCNKMTCTCGAMMCYLCDKPISDYKHFNPQGGTNLHLCPLWSDNKRLNAEIVRKVAEDIKKVVMKKNPNLKIDTEALMPQLPPKTKGPHNDIPNADQLPEHVQRVVQQQ